MRDDSAPVCVGWDRRKFDASTFFAEGPCRRAGGFFRRKERWKILFQGSLGEGGIFYIVSTHSETAFLGTQGNSSRVNLGYSGGSDCSPIR